MQQVEAGRLELDRDVNDYLDFRIPPRDGKPVTLRNLMTHTPGFEEAIKRLVTDRPDRLATPEEYLKAWIPGRIFPPGEVPAYSNYGVTLAGYLVERVSGERYDDYVERHVFDPLGMTRSTTRQILPEAFREHVSQGYMLGSGPARPFELFGVSPAGGSTTTVADMARFMIAWLQEGELEGARILTAETARQALGTRHPIVPPLNGMLLGFFEQGFGGRRIVGHDGDSQYFHSSLNLYPDEGVGVYLVINSTGRDGAAAVLPASFMSGFADRYFPEPAVEGTVGAAAAAAHARQMAGTYMSSRGQESNFFSVLGFLSQVKVAAGRGRRPPRARAARRARRADEMARSPALRLAAGRRQGAARGARRGRAHRDVQRRLRLALPGDAAGALVEVIRDIRSIARRGDRRHSRVAAGMAGHRPAPSALSPVAGERRHAGTCSCASRASRQQARSLRSRAGPRCSRSSTATYSRSRPRSIPGSHC